VKEQIEEIKKLLQAHTKRYDLDMNGEGNEPGLKTLMAIHSARADKHSRDIADMREQSRKRVWWAIGAATTAVIGFVTLAAQRVYTDKPSDKGKNASNP